MNDNDENDDDACEKQHASEASLSHVSALSTRLFNTQNRNATVYVPYINPYWNPVSDCW